MMFRWMAALAAAALLLAACGGGTDRTKAQVRLVNASSGYAQLELRVDDELRQGQVAYGSSASYVEVDPGEPSSISNAGSATPLLSFTPAVTRDRYFTLLAYGATGALRQVLLDDNVGAPDNNRTLLRVINAAPDAGTLDVYLTGSDESLASAVPVQAAAALGAVGPWITVTSTTWRLRVTAGGAREDLQLDVPALVLGSRQIVTLVLTPSRGGVLVNALLLNQQGDIARRDNPQARVRLAAGLADGAAVSVRVGSTDLAGNPAGLAAVGQYQLLAAGTQAVVLSVGGVARAPTSETLAAGADYTVLAYGSAASPNTGFIEDNNRLPTDASRAQVRLVNGVAGLSSAASMTVNGQSVPSSGGVAAGAASAYVPVTATTTATVTVSAAGLAQPLYSAINQTLVAGTGYTVFVLGPPTGATGLLRADR